MRSLRAGHPVPIAISMVARELLDPIGTEFGIVADEITYGADLETAMRSLYFRIGQDDLPLFVTAVAIQSSTGGNLGEILENLSGVIRQRFKMRRKIRALAAEGRASALILSSLPIVMFAVVQIITPQFYGSVWHEDLTKIALGLRRRLDGDRQFHHVPHGELQDLTMGLFSDGTMVGILVFLAAGTLAFTVMALIRVQGSVKRRAAGIGLLTGEDRAGGSRSLRYSSLKAAQQVIEYTTKHYSDGNNDEVKVLRRRLMQAGLLRNPRAAAYFFLARTVLAVVLAALVFFFAPVAEGSSTHWLLIVVGGIVGYIGPSLYIDKRIKARQYEHQAGFPDFMDLLVVCADSGLSMEASLDRVGRELGDVLSVARRQHPHVQSRDPRRAHHERGARASRRPARPRGVALVRDADPAVGGARLEHHRRAARVQRRHAAQAALARRGKGLQPAGQALAADDALHLPDAVRGHPAAGVRPALTVGPLIPQVPYPVPKR